MMKTIDLLYVGPIEGEGHPDVQALVDIATESLNRVEDFTPAFMLPLNDFSSLPKGIRMHARTFSEVALRQALLQTRYLLKLPSNESFLSSAEMTILLGSSDIEGVLGLSSFTSIHELIQKAMPHHASLLSQAAAGPAQTNPHGQVPEQMGVTQVLEAFAQDFQQSDFESVANRLASTKQKFPNHSAVEHVVQKLK